MSFLTHLLSLQYTIIQIMYQMLEIDDENFKYNVSEGLSCRDSTDRPVGPVSAGMDRMGGKYNYSVYTGMSIYQYIPVYTPGSYLLDLSLSP